MIGNIKCPVCHGTGRITEVMMVAMVKKTGKRTCTACGGKGWIPFIDHRETASKREIREDEGWKQRRTWKKAHYFVGGEGLCGQTGFYQGPYWQEVDDDLKCLTCNKKLAKRKAEA